MTSGYRVQISTPASRRFAVVGALIVAGFASVPLWGGRGLMVSLTELMVLVAIGQVWNLLAGYAGIYSFGQQAFIGIGAYTTFVLADLVGLNLWVALAGSTVVAGLIALPSAWLVFRLRGAYFAVGTWVLAETYRLLVRNSKTLYPSGTPQPLRSLSQVGADRFSVTFWVSLGLAVGVVIWIYLLNRSARGLALSAIRDNEGAANTSGVAVRRTQVMVYVMVASLTGLAGAVFLLKNVSIDPDSFFSIQWTAQMVIIVMIGGIGTIEGPIVGAVVFFLLRENLADLGTAWFIILGVLLIAIMLRAPEGIWGIVQRKTGLRLFPIQRRLVMDDLIMEKVSNEPV
ncbi:MAG TPA: branched-chain amino acid ABC transporter permease [Acidimicrobiia bacterium]|nr:branched-chain amino acid ABC transporter permease [Acidimicrobiia bacterium]